MLKKDLPVGSPLLLGRLRWPRGRTALVVDVWCPWCGDAHQHGWPYATHGYDAVGHRAAHCSDPDSPYRADGGYYIGLSTTPTDRQHNERVLKRWAKANRVELPA